MEATIFDVHTVANYLYSLNDKISPLKLQKSLYFLFAYHGAMYAKQPEEGVFEGSSGSQSLLFDARFEAWKYGPVIREVYERDRSGGYGHPEYLQAAIREVESHPEIKKFIDELFEDINSVSDFKLVDRSHQDEAWREAYAQGQSTPMNHQRIIEEYAEKYV